MPELEMDKEGNFVVSDALSREQLDEIASMLGVEADPKMNKVDLTGMLLSAGAVPAADIPPVNATPPASEPDAILTEDAASDMIEYLEKAGRPVGAEELSKKCGVDSTDIRNIIADNPGRIVTMKKKSKFSYTLNPSK